MKTNRQKFEPSKTHSYRVFGLKIQSDILLPELIADTSQDNIDVFIQCEQSISEASIPESTSQHFFVVNKKVVLKAEGFALAIENGKKMTIHCDNPTAHLESIRLRILGAGMGLLLQQRDHLVLHGATVIGKYGGVVIMGNSGDGKSTLTMQLAQQGYRLSGDDKCVIRLETDRIHALSGSPFIKLNKNLAAELAANKNRIQQVSALKDKLYIDCHTNFEIDDTPIIAGFVLGRTEQVSVEKLSQRQSFEALLDHNYRKKKLFKLNLQKSQFFHCQEVAKNIPIYQYSRSLKGDILRQPEPEFLSLLKDITGNG
jgi:hypothetical protein